MSTIKYLDKDLLKKLECPVCLKYMLSPITLCENGHNICKNCSSNVSACPSCTGRFLQVRNVALEDIARTANYPCKNREAGCNEIFCMDDKIGHESKCLYETRICPFTKLSGDSCSWTGVLSDVAAHVSHDHGCKIQSSVGIFSVKLETLCALKHHVQAVVALGKLFFVIWEIKECNIHFAVFHAGSQNGAKEFTYKLSIKTHNEEISMRATCHSYLQELSTVMQPGECIVLHYGAVLKYLSKSNNDLSCEIKIRRCSDSSVLRAFSKWFEEQGPPPSNRPTTAPTTAPIIVANSTVRLPDTTPQPSTAQLP